MNLLRIGQEAVANAIKHGRPSQIHIELQFTPEAVKLKVSDDGQGFSPEQATSAGHFGMLDMRERAESLGSEFQIESAPGRGTQITVEVRSGQQSISNAELKTHTYPGRG
jgi:signal transduction histidine kinase